MGDFRVALDEIEIGYLEIAKEHGISHTVGGHAVGRTEVSVHHVHSAKRSMLDKIA